MFTVEFGLKRHMQGENNNNITKITIATGASLTNPWHFEEEPQNTSRKTINVKESALSSSSR